MNVLQPNHIEILTKSFIEVTILLPFLTDPNCVNLALVTANSVWFLFDKTISSGNSELSALSIHKMMSNFCNVKNVLLVFFVGAFVVSAIDFLTLAASLIWLKEQYLKQHLCNLLAVEDKSKVSLYIHFAIFSLLISTFLTASDIGAMNFLSLFGSMIWLRSVG
jgi:hypothetical protein|tara:strand:- start:4016 stop:4507 length:492 start_codon:yes stop_codon:yes gene_type:complete